LGSAGKSRRSFALASIDAKAVTAGAFLGLVTPFGVELMMRAYPSIVGNWVFWLWPSLVVMVVFGMPAPVVNVRVLFAISVGINVLVFAVLCWYVTMLFDAAKRIATSHSN
jgi:hypothetical protein